MQTEVEQVFSLETHAEMTNMKFFDMLMLEADEVISGHTRRVVMDEGEVVLTPPGVRVDTSIFDSYS